MEKRLARGSASILFVCASIVSGSESFSLAARSTSCWSGILLQRNMDSRVANSESDRLFALFSSRHAGAYASVFQCFSEPVSVVASITEEPFHLGQAAQQSPRTDAVADLTGGDEQIEWAAITAADGGQLSVHATFGAPQATTPPFSQPCR